MWYSSWVLVMTVPLEGGLYSMWWIAWCDQYNAFRPCSCSTLIDLQSVVIRFAMTSLSLPGITQACPSCASPEKTEYNLTICAHKSGYIQTSHEFYILKCDLFHSVEHFRTLSSLKYNANKVEMWICRFQDKHLRQSKHGRFQVMKQRISSYDSMSFSLDSFVIQSRDDTGNLYLGGG